MYITQVFAKTTPEALSGFTNVKKRTSTAVYSVRKMLGLAGAIVTDSKRAFRASYLGERADVVAGMALGTLTNT